jgi:hypothetical protein
VLNNLDYHYMLQGKYEKARETLLAAQRNDPENVVIRHNIDLIKTRPDDGVPYTGREMRCRLVGPMVQQPPLLSARRAGGQHWLWIFRRQRSVD